MRRNDFLETSRSSVVNTGKVVKLCLSILAIVGSVALTWTFLYIGQAHASGIIETPTQTNPWAIAIDKSSNIWVAEPGCDAEPSCSTAFPSYIGEYKNSDVLLKNYLEPAGYSSPVFLIVNSTGTIWFTEYSANKIGFFNTTTQKFMEKVVPTAGSQPYGITKAPNGGIWFVENTQQKIGSFTPTTSGTVTITEHIINNPGGPTPHLITADSAGNIWYSEGFSGDIGEFVPLKNTFTNINVSVGFTQKHISGIAVDTTGRIWFDDSLNARIGYYNPTSGKINTLTLSNPNAHPHNGLATDSKGNTWVAEVFGGPTGSLAKIPAGTL